MDHEFISRDCSPVDDEKKRRIKSKKKIKEHKRIIEGEEMNIVIVDNDTNFVERFRQCVEQILLEYEIEGNQIKVYHTAHHFITEYKSEETDLLFLECCIGEDNGIELAKNLRNIGDRTNIIFISNQAEVVYETFAVSPLYFIQKERIEEETKVAMDLFVNKVLRPNVYINLRLKQGVMEVNLMQIKYIRKVQNEIIFYFKDYKTVKKRGTLKDVEQMLLPYYFVRVDNGCLLNIGYVQRIEESRVSLLDGTEITISRRRKKDVEQMYQKYILKGRDSQVWDSNSLVL